MEKRTDSLGSDDLPLCTDESGGWAEQACGHLPDAVYDRQPGLSFPKAAANNRGQNKENCKMWAGLPEGLYDFKVRDIPHVLIPRHIPTGITLADPDFFRGQEQGPYLLRGPNNDWAIELDIYQIGHFERARMLGLPEPKLTAVRSMYLNFGRLSYADSVRQTKGDQRINLDKQLLEIAAVLYFMSSGASEWIHNEQACPDRLVFRDKTLPPSLQIEIVNPHASS